MVAEQGMKLQSSHHHCQQILMSIGFLSVGIVVLTAPAKFLFHDVSFLWYDFFSTQRFYWHDFSFSARLLFWRDFFYSTFQVIADLSQFHLIRKFNMVATGCFKCRFLLFLLLISFSTCHAGFAYLHATFER